jgi:hypothetical protein
LAQDNEQAFWRSIGDRVAHCDGQLSQSTVRLFRYPPTGGRAITVGLIP